MALGGEATEDVGAEIGFGGGFEGVGEPNGGAGGVAVGGKVQGVPADGRGVAGAGEDVSEAAAQGVMLGRVEGSAGELVEQGQADAVGLGYLGQTLEELFGGGFS